MKSLSNIIYFNKKDIKTYILLLSAPLLLALYRYHGYAEYFGKYFPDMTTNTQYDLYAHFWQFFVFFFLLFIIPLIFIKFVFKESPKNYGLTIGNINTDSALIIIIVTLIIIAVAWFGSAMPDVRREYPLAKILLERHDLIFIYESFYVIFYYIAWEFFFRGFLLFGLKERFGAFNAILIQTISSCLVHIGKPEGEILGAIFLGIAFGIIALRTKSIWYVFTLHALMGVLTDLLIIYF